MKTAYKIFRAVVFTLLILMVAVPFAVYVALSTPWGQEMLRSTAETELTRLLGTRVNIESVEFTPFNRLEVRNISAEDDYGVKAAAIHHVSARFELMHFLGTGRIVIDYVDIEGLTARLYRKNAASPLNIDGIIKRLTKKEKKEEKPFSLAISTVNISNASATYDVLDAPRTPGRFNARHIAIAGLGLTAYLPRLSNHDVRVDLQDFTCREESGLVVSGLEARVKYTPTSLSVDGLRVKTPGSELSFQPLDFTFEKIDQLKALGRTTPVTLVLKKGSHVTPADFTAFAPVLRGFDTPVYIDFEIGGVLNNLAVSSLNVSTKRYASPFELHVDGNVRGLGNVLEHRQQGPLKDLNAEVLNVSAVCPAAAFGEVLGLLPVQTRDKLSRPFAAAGNVSLKATLTGTVNDFSGKVEARTSSGSVDAMGSAVRNAAGAYTVDAQAKIESLNLGEFTGNSQLGLLTADVRANGSVGAGVPFGELDLTMPVFVYNGRDFGGLNLSATATQGRDFTVDLDMNNSVGNVTLSATGNYNPESPAVNLEASLANVSGAATGVPAIAPYIFNGNLTATVNGRPDRPMDATVNCNNLRVDFASGHKEPLQLDNLAVTVDTRTAPNHISLESDILSGAIDGNINLTTLFPEARSIIASVMPALFPADAARHGEHAGDCNNFTFRFTVPTTDAHQLLAKLPVGIVYPVTLDGSMDGAAGLLSLNLDAQYLQQGDKIIDNTALNAELSREDGRGLIYVTTHIPTQKGPMGLVANLSAAANRVDSKINWVIERAKPISGDIGFSTLLGRTDGALTADVSFNRSDIIFGDESWSIAPSHISWRPKDLKVSDFVMRSGNQAIHIDGRATDDPDSQLDINLMNIRTVKIFETLDIDKALIGGEATGNAVVRNLFGSAPEIYCNDLHVKDISYNYCVLGDADVRASYDAVQKKVLLDADVTEPGGKTSRIWGSITPAGERLDINFDANHIKIGFLKPFMSAFAADVEGYASGRAHLFGTFKYIDLTGDLLAERVGLKIDFTNTWYYAENDSVHIRPGVIDIDNITLRDAGKGTARLNGFVRHDYFHNPVFDFRVTDARDLLVYDVGPAKSPIWYGHILGDGSATITGEPGVVNIGADMRTARGSKFTFVLSDTEEADDYTFIQFRDVTPKAAADTVDTENTLPPAVRAYLERQRNKQKVADRPSDYNMDFNVDITPDANIVLVMDPVGGDEINCYGKGNLRMKYASAGNDLRMYGAYTIDRGKYNFTLQDIIVKDFTISDGSSITFTGDPYAADLDIKAVYNVNANLSDLDESFLSDRDLARTNVPVHAVLMARGDMRQPDVSFDLEFPTLSSDIDRKVKAIISTEEMMNRQIIYLLALNRFYTPDYMQTTKGNELFSVASSTLSSQLASMLGKLSNNLSIAPNVRSDRGDFSDVEVDVALSGTLFNNRLRMNGNFGYRDRSNMAGTNQFIGDVDIEYLLNNSGTWRLKAYNRYNDQNYYLRTAQTTQGVGIMYKRDFDNLFGLGRGRIRSLLDPLPAVRPAQPAHADSTAADTTATR